MEFADDAALVEYLRDNDAPCPGCGYSMLGAARLVCPECGRRFRAGDVGRSPRPAWQVFLLSWPGWVLGMALYLVLCEWNKRVGAGEDLLSTALYSRLNVGLLPGLTGGCFAGWLIVRVIRRNRSQAEVFLKLGWGMMALYVAALVVKSL